MLLDSNSIYGASLVGFSVIGMDKSVIPYLGIVSLVARVTRTLIPAIASLALSGRAAFSGRLLPQHLQMVTFSTSMRQEHIRPFPILVSIVSPSAL